MALNLTKVIQDLRTEELRLSAAIAALEDLIRKRAEAPPTTRRGRKFMGAEERRRVGTRMREYWAGRKKKSATASAP
jgi:hypothetical protein